MKSCRKNTMRNPGAIPCILILVLLSATAIPAMAGGAPPGTPITLTVLSPNKDDTAWIDVVPPHVTILGRVDAEHGVQNVTASSSIGEVSCGNGTAFACSVPVAEGKDTITVTAVDTLGNTVKAVLNVTVNIGIPPPPTISVSGTVTDTGGHPIPGASVRFESVFTLDGAPLSVTTVTGDDGCYQIENAVGYEQKISVERDEYLSLHREIVFGNTTGRLDLELQPRARTVAGFCAGSSAPAIPVGLLLTRRRRRREA